MNDYVELHLPRTAYQRDYRHLFPGSPEAVQGGLLRDAHVRAERARERSGLASGAVNRLIRRQEAFEAIIRSARWDMTPAELAEVAGAKVGIELAGKERPALSEASIHAGRDLAIVEAELQPLWTEFQSLLRQMEERSKRGIPPERDQKKRVVELIGEWPEEPEPAVEAVLAGVGREG